MIIGIRMLSAIERIIDAARQSARNGDGHLALHASRLRTVFGNARRSGAERNQLRYVAAVEGQFENALSLHNLAHTNRTCFDQSCIGLNFDEFRLLADFQSGVYRGVAVHLKYDACLNKGAESR